MPGTPASTTGLTGADHFAVYPPDRPQIDHHTLSGPVRSRERPGVDARDSTSASPEL
ncbi:hypothetical protein [Streptomyces sp. NPDC092295]|uniref:hypothetical protein n=1 Tax=Streptomyces sp. NPDC092295 TaxID=3366011 RepID=UPI0038008996